MPEFANRITRSLSDKLGERPSALDFIPEAQHAAVRAGTANANLTSAMQSGLNAVASAGGGVLYLPWGVYPVMDLTIPGNVFLQGDGAARTILKRIGNLAAGRGVLNFAGAKSGCGELAIDGQVTTPATALYSSLSDPSASPLIANSSIRIHPGAADLTLFRCRIFHTGGYAVHIDARTANVYRVEIIEPHLHDNRSFLFGATAGSEIYGSWTGGILAQGDGLTNSYGVRGLTVRDGRFRRGTGNQVWSHLYGFGTLHTDVKIQGCTFEDIGRDGIMLGGVVGGDIAGNFFRRIGYICTDDASAGIPRWINGQWAVGLDTAGLTRGVSYRGNSFVSCYGAAMDLDGFAEGVVSDNTVIVPAAGEPEYTEDAIASWAGNYCYGAQTSNTNNLADAAVGVRVTGNRFRNCGFGAIRMYASRRGTVAGNTIEHPATASVAPIILGNIGSGANQRAYANTVTDNDIHYSPATITASVQEDPNGFAFSASDSNRVYGNRLHGTNTFEFLRAATSGSRTAREFASNKSGLATESKTTLQREDGYLRAYWTNGSITKSVLSLLDQAALSGGGSGGPLLNISLDAVGGVIATGARTSSAFDDAVLSSKFYADGFLALAATTFAAAEANLLADTVGLIRYNATTKAFEQSTSASAGARVWTPFEPSRWSVLGADIYRSSGRVTLGSSIPASLLTLRANTDDGLTITNNTQTGVYFVSSYGGPTVGATSNHPLVFITNNAARGRITDAGNWLVGANTEDASGARLQIAGFARATVGFATPSTNTDAIQATGGGVTARFLIGTRSLTLVGDTAANAGVSGLGQGRIYFDSTANRFRISENGGAFQDLTGAGVTSLAGTANQVSVSAATGAVTLSLPQNIHSGAQPTFDGLSISAYLYTKGGAGGNGSQSHLPLAGGDGRNYIRGGTVLADGGGNVLVATNVDDGSGARLQINGFARAITGFATPSSATDAIQASSGGVTARFLIGTRSLTLVGDTAANAGVSGLGQGRIYFDSSTNKFRVSENGAAFQDLTGPGVISLAGTANQVIVSAATGAVTLSLPQSIHTAASPTFGGATINGNVGIGTPLAQTLLTVGSYVAGTGEATTRGYIQIQDPNEAATIDGSRGLEFKSSPSGAGYGYKLGTVAGVNLAIGYRQNSATFTELVRINNSGNVLIGTTAQVNFLNGLQISKGATDPQAEAGSLLLTGASTAHRLALGYSSTYSAAWVQSVLNGVAPTALLLNPLGGNVGIGTTAPQAAVDVATGGLHVRGVQYATSGSVVEVQKPSSTIGTISMISNGATRALGDMRVYGSPVSLWPGGLLALTATAAGNVGIGTPDPAGKLHIAGTPLSISAIYQDGADRPSLGLTGHYPQIVLMSQVANPNHGPTIMLGSKNSGDNGNKHWSIGTSGQDSTFLDIGYHSGADFNPHSGIRSYNGLTCLTLLSNGNVLVATTNDDGSGAKLQVNGFVRAASGFSTPSANTDALQAPSGGVTARFLIGTRSLTLTADTAANAGLSAAGQGRIYYDSGTNKFRVSENGGPFQDLTGLGVTSLTGTANQVNVSAAAGAVTLSLPQNVHTGAAPTFDGLTLASYFYTRGGTAGNGAQTHLPWPGDFRNYIRGTTIMGDTGGNVLVATSTDDGSGARLQINGFARAITGFATPSSATDALQAPSGGVTARFLIGTRSLTLAADTSANAGLSGSGQGRIYFDSTSNKFRVSENGGAYADLLSTAGVTSLTGTANQVNVSASTGAVTLSLPQNIHAAASPTFGGLVVNGAFRVGSVAGLGSVDGNTTLSAGQNMVYQVATSGAALTWNANTNGGNANTVMARLQPRQDTSANYNLDVFCGSWNNNNSPGSALATFQSTGNVGLNETNPRQRLHVFGQGLFTASPASYDPGDAAGSAVRVGYQAGSDFGYVIANNTGVSGKKLVVGGSTIEYWLSGAAAHVMNASGNLLIATLVDDSSGAKLQVNGFARAITGFATPSSATDAIQATVGGVTARFLVGTRSLTLTADTAANAGLSAAGQGRIFYDSGTNKFRVSENGGAYVDLASGNYWRQSAWSLTNADEWPTYVFVRDGSANWDEGIIKGASNRSKLGAVSAIWGPHLGTNNSFGVFSSGWDNLFEVRGGSGNVWIKGNVGMGTASVTAISSNAPRLEVVGSTRTTWGHGQNALFILPAANNGASNGDAGIYLWISEPGHTWTGAGIGRNMYNWFNWPRVNLSLSGQMIRFGEGTDITFTSESVAGNRYYPLTLVEDRVLVATQSDNGSGAKLQVAGGVTAAPFNATATGAAIAFQTSNGSYQVDGNGNISGSGSASLSQGYRVGGTFVIDSSRNATNLASATAAGVFQSQASGGNIAFQTTNFAFQVDGNGNISGSGSANLSQGFRVGGTFVIDSSRNATNLASATAAGVFQSQATGGNIAFQTTNFNFQVNGNGVVSSAGGINVSGVTCINTSRQFVGYGVDVSFYGVSAGGYNVFGGYVGQTWNVSGSFTINGAAYSTLVFRGGILVSAW
jgi:hypothetical protein